MNSDMITAYGVLCGVACGLWILAIIVVASDWRYQYGSNPAADKRAAQDLLKVLGIGPFAVLLWPLSLVAVVGYLVRLVIRDATKTVDA